jgi:NADPH-dependent ferric siderophore reductase
MEFVAAIVVEAFRLTERFHRIVLHVPDLIDLNLPTAADAAIGIYFTDSDPGAGRTYTVRDCDPERRRITVDFILHGNGLGTDWVRQVAPADQVRLGHAGSWYQPPPQCDAQLLIADLAGLPALARVIEGLPPNANAVAIAEVLDDSDLDYLPRRQDIEFVASVGTGNGINDGALVRLATMRGSRGDRDYCWFGGEAGAARAIRKYLRRELCWSVQQFDVMGYWRPNSGDWDMRYAEVGPQLFASYQKALAEGMGERLAAEEFDLALERKGL